MNFQCPHCKQVMSADASLYGKPCNCIRCQQPLIAPVPRVIQPVPQKKGIEGYVWLAMFIVAAIIFLPKIFPTTRSQVGATRKQQSGKVNDLREFMDAAPSLNYQDGYREGRGREKSSINEEISALRSLGASEAYLKGWRDGAFSK